MPLLLQTLIGSGILLACTLVHILIVVVNIPLLKILGTHYRHHPLPRTFVVFSATVFVLLFSHSIQIWAWAALFLRFGQLPDLATSLYFATVTYTTLGYGDVVLDESARLLGTFGAITGLITFGISTAFLIGVLGRVLPEVFGSDQS